MKGPAISIVSEGMWRRESTREDTFHPPAALPRSLLRAARTLRPAPGRGVTVFEVAPRPRPAQLLKIQRMPLMIVSQPAQQAFTRRSPLLCYQELSSPLSPASEATGPPTRGKGHLTGLPAPGKACLAPGQSSPPTPSPCQPTRQEASWGLQSVPCPMGCLRGQGPGTVVDAAIHGSWSGRAQVRWNWI